MLMRRLQKNNCSQPRKNKTNKQKHQTWRIYLKNKKEKENKETTRKEFQKISCPTMQDTKKKEKEKKPSKKKKKVNMRVKTI